MKHKVSTVILAIAAAVSGAPALASGSGGSGGGYGGGFGSGHHFPQGDLIDPAEAAYARGQSQYRKRITCKTCPLPKETSKNVPASEIAAKVRAGEFGLSPQQRADVLFYLQRRYGVRG